MGPIFGRAWPIEEGPCFSGLLEAIDEAEREHWRAKDTREEEAPSDGLPSPHSEHTLDEREQQPVTLLRMPSPSAAR